MSPLPGGLAPRGQLIVAGAGGDEPISVAPVPLLFGMRSLAGTMTGSSIDAIQPTVDLIHPQRLFETIG